jgi:hypothetical protein
MRISTPNQTLLKILAVWLLVFIGYKFYSIEYSYPRVAEIARLASRRLVSQAEKSGKPLDGTLLRLKKMLDSPIVQARVIPGDLNLTYAPKLHTVSGFTIFYADPFLEPDPGTITLSGRKVRLADVPPAVEAKLKAMGAVPYTIESSLQSLMKTLENAQENNTAVVIASRHGDDLYNLLVKFTEYSRGKKFSGVTIIIITDSLSPSQAKAISRGLGAEPYQFSYKEGLHDFLPW